MRKHLDKARHIEAEFDTTVSTIGHLDGNMYLAQNAGKKQQQKSKHD
jgi:ribosomal protein S11